MAPLVSALKRARVRLPLLLSTRVRSCVPILAEGADEAVGLAESDEVPVPETVPLVPFVDDVPVEPVEPVVVFDVIPVLEPVLSVALPAAGLVALKLEPVVLAPAAPLRRPVTLLLPLMLLDRLPLFVVLLPRA